MEDLEETSARERCGKYRGDFSTATQGRYQCKGGANFRIIEIVGNISTYNISQYGKSTSVSVGFLTGTTLTFPPGLLGDTMLIKMNIHGKENFIF